MLAEIIPPRLLTKVFTTVDLTAVFIAIIMFIPNASGIGSGAGNSTYVWWILGFLFFLIPGAYVVGELGVMFPEEGSIYVWTTKAFGDVYGFIAGWFAWIPGLVSLTLTTSIAVGFAPAALGLTGIDFPTQTALGFAVIWISAIIGLTRVRLSQNYINVSAVVYSVVVAIIGLAGVAWLLGGHAPANPITTASLTPSFTTVGAFGFVILALLGVEIPMNMGIEIKDKRSITRHLVLGSLVVMVLYLFATFGVLATQPTASMNPLTGVSDAIGIAFNSTLGRIAAIIFFFWFFVNTTVYNVAFARLMFVAGVEKRLPLFMSHVNKRSRVPDVAILVQAGVISILWLIIQLVLSGTSSFEYLVLSAATTIVWCVSMLFLFADLRWARKKNPEAAASAKVIPGGSAGRAIIVGLGLLATLFAIGATLWAPWTSALDQGTWNVDMAVIYIPLVVLGALVYISSRRRVKAISLERELEYLEAQKAAEPPQSQ
jgi:amino acid transporter